MSDMASASQSKVTELKAKIERMNEQLEELKEYYGVEDEDDGEEVFIPAAGRTNYENGVGSTATTDGDEPETETAEVEIPTAGRSNGETTTIEREVPADSGMEEVEDFNAYMHQTRTKEEERRVERPKETRERRMNNVRYALDDEDAVDTSDIPAAGRSNWEKRQEE